jgi:glutaminyl-peptide cyclotransferase
MVRLALRQFRSPFRTAVLLLLQSLAACSQESKTEPASDSRPKAAQIQPVPVEIWKEFSGALAFAEVEKQVAFGPRPAGSQVLAEARVHLTSVLHANGWTVEPQTFVAQTPHGALQMTNLIARFGGAPAPSPTNTQQVIVASHYDTKSFSTISFVGANDGASSSGALLELSRVLALDPALAARVELVFFDGEEALQQFTETDGLYGSRHYAAHLRDSGRAAQFKFAVVWDMIGDRNLTVTLPLDSPKELTQGLLASAEALQHRGAFRIFDRPMLDDHVPLNLIARIPAIDIIDFEYDVWHTADDTMLQISADSLQTIGSTTLHLLKKSLQ